MNTTRSNFARPMRRRAGAGGRSSRRGFTLIEVLATLLLLSITLPVIMKGITLATHVAATGKTHSAAASLAESKLNELVGTNEWSSGALQGDFGTDWPAYTWTAEVNPWGQPVGVDATNIVQELDVHVLWTDAGRPQILTVSTLVYQSANAGTSSSSSGGGS